MQEQELFVDHTPRRARALRWCRRRVVPAMGRQGRRLVVPVIVTGALFGGILSANRADPSATAGAPTTQAAVPLGAVQPIDYREECLSEGCNKEEVQELWNSFQSECFDEQCWTEEVLELAGGADFVDDPFNPQTKVTEMLDAFRRQLGKQFMTPNMRVGYTDDLWSRLVQLLDGKVIWTPEMNCDEVFC